MSRSKKKASNSKDNRAGKRRTKAGGGGEDLGVLYCPQCRGERAFVWDAYLAACRCPDCGTTTEDFYVRTHNRLWSDPPGRKEAVERAIRESGREWPRPKRAEEAPAPPPEGSGPNEARLAVLGFTCVRCRCGGAFWAGDGEVSCPACLRRYEIRSGLTRVLEDPQLRCSRCGTLVTDRPVRGHAYMCQRCGAWCHVEGDREGEAEARRAERAAKAAESVPGTARVTAPLRVRTLAKVKSLVVKECCNYSDRGPYRIRDWCWQKDMRCVFFGTPPTVKLEMDWVPEPEWMRAPRAETWEWDEEEIPAERRFVVLTRTPAGAEKAYALEMRLLGVQGSPGGFWGVLFVGSEEAAREVAKASEDDPRRLTFFEERELAVHRCPWFEAAVLPLADERLRRDYWAAPAAASMEGPEGPEAEALEEAPAAGREGEAAASEGGAAGPEEGGAEQVAAAPAADEAAAPAVYRTPKGWRTCKGCRRPFHPANPRERYCSEGCRSGAREARTG